MTVRDRQGYLVGTYKVCTFCRLNLPIDAFYRRSNGKYLARCRTCQIAHVTQHQRDPDEICGHEGCERRAKAESKCREHYAEKGPVGRNEYHGTGNMLCYVCGLSLLADHHRIGQRCPLAE